MRYTFRVLNIPVWSFESEPTESELTFQNLGGQFEIAYEAEGEEEGYEYSPDDPEGFGFRRP